EKLFQEALRYTFENVGKADYEEPGSHPYRLARIIETSLPHDPETRRDGLLWQELWLRAARDEPSREFTLWLYAETRSWIADLIREGIAAGEFRECDADAVADLILVLTDGYSVHLTFADPATDLAEAEATIWRLISADLGLHGPIPPRKLSTQEIE